MSVQGTNWTEVVVEITTENKLRLKMCFRPSNLHEATCIPDSTAEPEPSHTHTQSLSQSLSCTLLPPFPMHTYIHIHVHIHIQDIHICRERCVSIATYVNIYICVLMHSSYSGGQTLGILELVRWPSTSCFGVQGQKLIN